MSRGDDDWLKPPPKPPKSKVVDDAAWERFVLKEAGCLHCHARGVAADVYPFCSTDCRDTYEVVRAMAIDAAKQEGG